MARTGSPGSRKGTGDDKVRRWVIGFVREHSQVTAITRVLLEGELPVSSTYPSVTASYLESPTRSLGHVGGFRATGEL